jgi:hypothetical protein
MCRSLLSLLLLVALTPDAWAHDHEHEREHEHEHEHDRGHFERNVEENDEYRMVSETNHHEGTMLLVVAPESAQVLVFDGQDQIFEDDVPCSVKLEPGRPYHVKIVTPNFNWGKKMEFRHDTKTALWVKAPGSPNSPVVVTTHATPLPPQQPPPPPPPQPMSPQRFAALQGAINAEGFPDRKIAVLRTAATGDTFFTCDQLGALIDLFAFPNNKVDAVAIVKSHLVDPDNAFTLYGHFAFPDDKEKVQKMFSH